MKPLFFALLLSMSQVSAFADVDCTKVNLAGEWAAAENVTTVVAIDSQTKSLTGMDQSEIYNCWGPNVLYRTYYTLQFDQKTCIIDQQVTKFTSASTKTPAEEKDETAKYADAKQTYYKVLDYSAGTESRKLVLAPCTDSDCKEVKFSDTITLNTKKAATTTPATR
jgi:hypothetical protein